MNVTYLFGNGFDLGIGLKTGFKDFLKYYLTIVSFDEDIIKFKETIRKESIDLWADLELKFGEYINIFKEENLQSYIKIHSDILRELNNYLKIENGKITDDISINDIEILRNWFLLKDLESIGFNRVERGKINDTKYHNDRIDIIYRFLAFNYTTTLEKILNKVSISSSSNNVLYSQKYTDRGKTEKAIRYVKDIIHVHGELDKYLIMGVNDESQLPFSGIIPSEIIKRLIKPTNNERIGERIDEIGANFITQSDIICIYGMALGDTDTIWWERIGKWLMQNNAKQLIIFKYDEKLLNRSVDTYNDMLQAKEDCQDYFLKISKIPENIQSLVKDKITVIINSGFMQMNLIKDEKGDENKSKSEVTV